jgi:hypothetical protein
LRELGVDSFTLFGDLLRLARVVLSAGVAFEQLVLGDLVLLAVDLDLELSRFGFRFLFWLFVRGLGLLLVGGLLDRLCLVGVRRLLFGLDLLQPSGLGSFAFGAGASCWASPDCVSSSRESRLANASAAESSE